MKQITITLDTPDIIALEKGGDRAAVTKVEEYFSVVDASNQFISGTIVH
jgi:hypothetical protein